ncbi:hypothetical protein [Blastococcus sp. SYSU DS0619]
MAVLTHVQAPTVARRFASWWKRPALLVMAALAAGMAASLLFVWPYGGAGAEPTFADIFFHNVLLGVVLVVASPYVAWPAVLFNGFFLGFVLQAGATTHGWEDTARLAAVHVPLEVLAWLVTLWCSVLLADLAGRAWHTRERPARHEVVQLVRAGVVATVFYLVAAGAEWFELWLVVRGGNPA